VTDNDKLPQSLWAATAIPAPDYAGRPTEHTADVVVVGAGYTGLSTALHLALKGKACIVVEAAEPGWGGSGRNGGQVIAGLKATFAELRAAFGEDLGMRMAKNMGRSADLAFALIDKYKIDCHATRSGWIQAAHGAKPYRETVIPRYQQWRSAGVPAQLLDQQEVAKALGCAPDAYVGGWLDPRCGTLQPLSYARGLAAAAMQEGATILARTKVHGLRRTGGMWEVSIDDGTLRAPQVVLATNAYTGARGETLWPKLAEAVIPVASFQMATKPLSSNFAGVLPDRIGVSDSRRLLLYFRRDHTDRLVMGGRSPVDDNPVLDDARALQRAIGRIFPQLGEPAPEFVWSGKVAITKDKRPHIYAPAPGLSVFLGCNGRGVANCTMMGRLLADLASGVEPAEIPFPITVPDSFAFHKARKVGVFALSQYYRMLDALEAR
jgi:glycine/D-amino acid oxidase-like deaminating enzyme